MVKERKYNVKVAKILPEGLSLEEVREQSAYFIVSLSNPNHYGKRLGAILQFLDAHFDKVLVLTSGFLYRYNFMIANGGDYDRALQGALSEEEAYFCEELAPYAHILNQDKFCVSRWSDYVVLDEWQCSYQEVKTFFETDSLFKHKLEETATTFLSESRYLKEHGDQSLNYFSHANVQHALYFLLEESAMFDYLVKVGYRVCLYPGTFPAAINDILCGYHPLAPTHLKNRIHVKLRVSRCGRKNKVLNLKADPETIHQDGQQVALDGVLA